MKIFFFYHLNPHSHVAINAYIIKVQTAGVLNDVFKDGFPYMMHILVSCMNPYSRDGASSSQYV